MTREQGPFFDRLRNPLAVGATALVALWAASPVALAKKAEHPQQRVSHSEALPLKEEAIYSLGTRAIGIFREVGASKEGAYSTKNIKSAVVAADQFGKRGEKLEFLVPEANISVPFNVVITPNKTKLHAFVVTKSVSDTNLLTHGRSPDLNAPGMTAKRNMGAVTYLAPAPQGWKSWLNSKISTEAATLDVESCQNLMQVSYTAKTQKFLKDLHDKRISSIFSLIKYEAACNSYGVAKASKDSGLTYRQYSRMTRNRFLSRAAARGLNVTIPVFSKKQYLEIS